MIVGYLHRVVVGWSHPTSKSGQPDDRWMVTYPRGSLDDPNTADSIVPACAHEGRVCSRTCRPRIQPPTGCRVEQSAVTGANLVAARRVIEAVARQIEHGPAEREMQN